MVYYHVIRPAMEAPTQVRIVRSRTSDSPVRKLPGLHAGDGPISPPTWTDLSPLSEVSCLRSVRSLEAQVWAVFPPPTRSDPGSQRSLSHWRPPVWSIGNLTSAEAFNTGLRCVPAHCYAPRWFPPQPMLSTAVPANLAKSASAAAMRIPQAGQLGPVNGIDTLPAAGPSGCCSCRSVPILRAWVCTMGHSPGWL